MGYQHRAEVRPGQNEPGDNDEGENKVIEEAAQFPKAEGVGEECAKRISRRLRKSWGMRRGRRLHERRIRFCSLLSSTLYHKESSRPG